MTASIVRVARLVWACALAVAPTVRLVTRTVTRLTVAVLAGAMFVEAHNWGLDGHEGAAMALWVVASTLIGLVLLFDACDALDTREVGRQLAGARRRIATLNAANAALRESVRKHKAFAWRWQQEAERAETDAQTAIAHTELGPTLDEIRRSPDTRRAS